MAVFFLVMSLSVTLAFSQGNPAARKSASNKFETGFEIAQADTDSLLDLLHKKQAELNAQGNSAAAESPSKPEKPAATSSNTATSPADQNDLLEILRRKQAELNAQSGTRQEPVATEAAPKPVEPPTRPVQPAPRVSKPKAVAEQPAVAPQTQDQLLELLRQKEAELNAPETGGKKQPVAAAPKTQDDLLEILRRKQAELSAQETGGKKQEPVAVTPKPVEPPPRVEPVRPPKATPPVSKPANVASRPALTPKAQDQLFEALRQKEAELDAKEGATAKAPSETARPAATAKTPTATEKAREDRVHQLEAEIAAKEEAFKNAAAKKEEAKAAMENKRGSKAPANAAPVLQPGSKEARLAELLRKYMADEITPHQYHMERAKIIAEP